MLQPDNLQASFQICHRSNPPAKKILAVRIRDLPMPNRDYQLTLTCLQGLINRETPTLYLVQDIHDEQWLNWLVERGDIDSFNWTSFEKILQKYSHLLRGMVIIDPEIPASINIATMLASIQNLIPVTPLVAQSEPIKDYLKNSSAGQVVDLRDFHWSSDTSAYRWLYDQHYNDLSHKMCAMMDPYDHPLKDYMVAFKIPIFWVKSDREELAFVEELLMKLPPNIPCLGWPQADNSPDVGLREHRGIILLNEYAKFEVCSGYEMVSRAVSNISVHSGAKPAKCTPVPLSPLSLEDKVYVTLIRTDGDGPNFYRECYRILWDEPEHGTIPVGWQEGPLLNELIPDIMDWFYQHSSPNDTFINALVGVGYIHEENYAYMYPPEQRKAIWDEYIHLSKVYQEERNFSYLTTYSEMSEEKLKAFCRVGFKGIFANYCRSFVTSWNNQVLELEGVPVFRAINGAFAGNHIDDRVNDIREWIPRKRPAFVFVSLDNWYTRMEYIKALTEKLGDECIFVTPEQMVDLYWQAKKG